MRQNKDGQPVSLFEVVELYHQPSRRIAFLHGAAQVGKIVHNEDFTAGLQCHLLHAADDGFLSLLLGTYEQNGAAVSSNVRYGLVSLIYLAYGLL